MGNLSKVRAILIIGPIVFLLFAGCKPTPGPQEKPPEPKVTRNSTPPPTPSKPRKAEADRIVLKPREVLAKPQVQPEEAVGKPIDIGKGRSAQVIEAAIREQVGASVGSLTMASIMKVKELYLVGEGISDLSPLSTFKNLKILNLRENSVKNLSPLANLTGLEKLGLDGNAITDLSPLAGIKGLQVLEIADNPGLTLTKIEQLQKTLPKCSIYHDLDK